jgi:DNA-binding SARP family transcriptional activator
MTGQPAHTSPVTEPQWGLELFGAWRLSRDDATYPMRTREQRLIALLALQGRRRRSYLAGILWPDSTEARASANLRAAIFRSDHVARGLLLHNGSDVALASNLRIDVHDFIGYVWRLSTARQAVTDADADALTCLRLVQPGDLLPGWYDDWVIYERARLQQLRVQALEAAAERMLARGELSAALMVASAAVTIEPLRESAQRTLIRIHLRDGNYHSALRDYSDFRYRLQRELSIAPSAQMLALVRPLLQHRPQPAAEPETSAGAEQTRLRAETPPAGRRRARARGFPRSANLQPVPSR